jgi:uncharacterized membrane protein
MSGIFSVEEERQIVRAIQLAERRTSGEIRVFVEDVCDEDHPLVRAAAVFHEHGMDKTRDRNAVLIYLAPESRQFAIWGDQGIHNLVGFHFWESEKQLLRRHLKADQAASGVCMVIEQIGERLAQHFPALEGDNPNELPNDIIYG